MYLIEKEGRAKGEKIMNKKHFYAAVILLLFLVAGIQPAHALTHSLSEGVNTDFGTWNGNTFTFHSGLDGDSIQIMSNDVIVDGAGNTISGASGTGVELNGRLDVDIQNLTITGCGVGIDLLHSGRINVTNNSVTNCQWGIRLIGAGTCTIEGNIVSHNSNTGIFLGSAWFGNTYFRSVNNDLYNNTILNNNFGITISEISLTGYPPEYTNKIYNNNFINNAGPHAEVVISQPGANVS